MNGKPNIIYVLSDQHRGQAMSHAGDPNVRTPAMGRLAAEGVSFRRAYSNCPVCTPSRGTIFSGRHAHCGPVPDFFAAYTGMRSHGPPVRKAKSRSRGVMVPGGGRSIHEMVHFADWLPTILAMANVPLPAGNLPLDGINVLPVLRGENGQVQTRRCWQWNRYAPLPDCNAAVRDGEWKLIHPWRDRGWCFDTEWLP